MIIDCISDLHGYYPELEGGDLLIIAGDLTARDTEREYRMFREWVRMQDYDRKIFIGGNHDNWIQKNCAPCPFPKGEPWLDLDAEYLCDSGTEFTIEEEFKDPVTINGEYGTHKVKRTLKIWGSSWTKRFEGMNPNCMAFTVETDEELAEKWAMIPEDTDILVTHSPPYGVLDEVHREVFCGERDESVGSESLIKPMIKSGCRLHVFGHIHQSYGKFYNPILGITYVNASHVNERYQPENKPIRVEL